jgi:hypothetical protein
VFFRRKDNEGQTIGGTRNHLSVCDDCIRSNQDSQVSGQRIRRRGADAARLQVAAAVAVDEVAVVAVSRLGISSRRHQAHRHNLIEGGVPEPLMINEEPISGKQATWKTTALFKRNDINVTWTANDLSADDARIHVESPSSRWLRWRRRSRWTRRWRRLVLPAGALSARRRLLRSSCSCCTCTSRPGAAPPAVGAPAARWWPGSAAVRGGGRRWIAQHRASREVIL